MPVSVVVKALKMKGLGKYRHGYTEFLCTVGVFNSGCSLHLTSEYSLASSSFRGLYNTYNISATNHKQPLQTQHK